jgi:hypothetical protein
MRSWGHVSLFVPWSCVRSPLGEQVLGELGQELPSKSVYPTGGDVATRYLDPLVNTLPPGVASLGTKVVGVTRAYLPAKDWALSPELRSTRRFRILTRHLDTGEERHWNADFVFDCTGGRAPGWIGSGSIPAIGEMGSRGQIFDDIPDIAGRDRIHFLGKRTLLVGCGPAAALCAIELARLIAVNPDTGFLWVTRGQSELPCQVMLNDPLSRRDVILKKANLLVAKKPQGLYFLNSTQVDAVRYLIDQKKFYVTLQIGKTTRRISCDSVVSAVGTRPHSGYILELSGSEIGFYRIADGTHRDMPFYLEDGQKQIRDAFREVTGGSGDDLYAFPPIRTLPKEQGARLFVQRPHVIAAEGA